MVKSRDANKGEHDKVITDKTAVTFVPAKEAPSDEVIERGKWGNELDFVMSSISYAIGLGNVWRFPYLCYQYGGGAFLLPYLICLITCGIPLFFMEVALGQAMSAGSVTIWKISPIMKGIGYATMSVVAFSNVYYIIIIAWTLFYLFASFNSELPWANCGHWWNSDTCGRVDHSVNTTTNETVRSPVEEFWNDRVLQISSGIDVIGGIQWELVGCLVLAWILVYLVIWKGIHSSGKIIWFTAMFPYVILLILLVRGLMLEGAVNGLYYYINPSFEKLLDPQVWVVAGSQIFYTFGIGMGSLIALGSYNDYRHNSLRDSLIVCAVGVGTSMLAGTVIFSVLGHMAHIQQKNVSDVVSSGPGLAFLSYPEVISELPISPLWAVLFFTMLMVLGIDSEFCCVEALVTGIVDEFPKFLRPRRKLFTVGVCIFMFFLGLPMVTNGGMYLFQLLDNYAVSGITLLFIVFWQTFTVSWIYGVDKLSATVKDMMGFRPPLYFIICWKYLSILIILAIFVFSFIKYTPLVYANTYHYPGWGYAIGWLTGVISMMWIPAYALYYLFLKSRVDSPMLSIRQRFFYGLRPPQEDFPLDEKKHGENATIQCISISPDEKS